MKIPKPEYSNQYPAYILLYWFVCWSVIFFCFFALRINKITSDGKYIRYVPCEVEIPAGRFEEGTRCVEYGEPFYVPAGEDLKNFFIRTGIFTGCLFWILGGLSMWTKMKEEKLKY